MKHYSDAYFFSFEALKAMLQSKISEFPVERLTEDACLKVSCPEKKMHPLHLGTFDLRDR